MTVISKYQIVDGCLVGNGLRIEAAALVEPERQANVEDGKLIILDAICDLLNAAYLSGQKSVLINYDERRALQATRDELGALKVLAGGLRYEHYDRAIAAITKVLAENDRVAKESP